MRLIKLAAAALIGLGVIAAAGFWWLSAWSLQPMPNGDTVRLDVPRGASLARVSRSLQDTGLVADRRLFSGFARWRGVAGSIRAGEYDVPAGETPARLLERLVAGDVVTYRVQLIEGWTVAQVLAALRSSAELTVALPEATAENLLTELGLPEGPRGGHAEGLLFPDTYVYRRGDSDRDILLRAHAAMQDRLRSEWPQRAVGLPYDSPYDALIMASIIEKETGEEDERGRISGVFVRRLQRGMRLQTDPSVIYGVGAAFDGNLTRAHLDRDGPYNTYRRRGLPPTPISLPGRESLHAALHPEAGDALYFVSRGDGTSEFSATLEQHLAAVRRYQLEPNR